MDIYLLDQVMKERFAPGSSILDAGCGSGRNSRYFIEEGYNVSAVDESAAAISNIRSFAAHFPLSIPAENSRCEAIENLSFSDDSFDAVLSIAVLHFARDPAHFESMLNQMWRVLRPGGIFFARLASSIGIENTIQPIGNGRYHLPDGSDRFLVDMETLLGFANAMNARQLEPIKTVNVQKLRCMTTWVLSKR